MSSCHVASSSSSSVTLQTVVNIPAAGLGTSLSSAQEVGQAVDWALEAGVRLVDTAYLYRNEAEIGAVVKRWIAAGRLRRQDLFVVTKLPMVGMHPEDVEEYCTRSLRNLGLDYVDLYLIHTPFGVYKDEKTGFLKFYEGNKVKYDHDTDHVSIWREMERMVDLGRARSIGVSNFSSEQCERIAKVARVPIAANQVECHAYFQQRRLRETMGRLGIRVMAYGPLGSQGRSTLPGRDPPPRLLEDPVVLSLAAAHSKSPAQILLRHLLQLGLVVIPKSVREARIAENFDLFDFVLSAEEMARMEGLDRGSAARSFALDALGSAEEGEDVAALEEYPFGKKKTADEY